MIRSRSDVRSALFWLAVAAIVVSTASWFTALVRKYGFVEIATHPWWGVPMLVGVLVILPTIIAGTPWLLDQRGRQHNADRAAIPAGVALFAFGIATAIIGGLNGLAIMIVSGLMFMLTGVPLSLTRLLPDE